METIKNTVFQVDSPIVKKARALDNYIIETNKVAGTEPKICAIYFSSNFIYYPNNEASFCAAIFDKNRFEWWNLRHPKACKHIFIRDVYKQWYLHGINVELDSIEKLSDFLKEEFSEYLFWIANYNFYREKIEDDWLFWQFTEKASLPGIKHRVDVNIYNGDLQQLQFITVE